MSPVIELHRLYLDDATIGVWRYEGEQLFSIEKPWRDNRPFESCIPEGHYTLRRVDSPRFGPGMWSVLEVPERTHILIHAANGSADVVGCIGLGMSVFADLQGIGESRKAIKHFYNWAGDKQELSLWVSSGLNTQP